MPLENTEIAAMFVEMADLLQIKGGDRHRVGAFRRSARIIEGLPRPAAQMLERGELPKIRGVGKGTIHRIKQMLRRHSCDDLDELRRSVPLGLRELLKIKGIGPTMVRNIHNRLGVTTLEQLEHAAKAGAIETIPRMGLSHAQKILAGIEAYRKRRGKTALIDAERVGRRIVAALRELPAVEGIALAGSVRRRKATIGDLDVLVATRDPAPVLARFQTLPEVESVLIGGRGTEGRCSVRLRNQQQADLRLLPPASFGAGLHYFTGSKQHNIELRKRANAMGLKVSDKGVFHREGEALIDGCADEEAVFRHLGLPWIAPELREGRGEFEAAARGRLPRLVRDEDLLGDLHMHTTDSDGRGSLRDMAAKAAALGHRYIAITDHSKALRIANGLDEARLAEQLGRIRAFEARGEFPQLRVLAGVEVDILEDGRLDLDPELLAQLDWVIASVHQRTNLSREAMTRRVVRAIESGVVDCIGHPTGRRPGKRDPFALDLEAVMAAAREHDVALECNGGPMRMDLGDVDCRRCGERGVSVSIATDAHSPAHLGRHEYGLAMARRGWLEPAQIVNAQPWETLAQRRTRRLREHGLGGGGIAVAVPRSEDAAGFAAGLEGGELAPAGFVLESLEVAQEHAWGDGDELEVELASPVPVEAPAEVESQQVEPELELELEPEVESEAATEAEPSPVDVLLEALAQRPLAEETKTRLSVWLMQGGGDSDPTLEAALQALGGNSLQRAFEIIYDGTEV